MLTAFLLAWCLGVPNYLDAASWDKLFPHRDPLYTFQAFQAAAARFPGFLSEAASEGRRRELAAFLANIAQETSGGWAQAPPSSAGTTITANSARPGSATRTSSSGTPAASPATPSSPSPLPFGSG